MKKLLFICVLLTCIFTACKTGVYTAEYGKEDVAYICLISSDEMANKDVVVYIDNETQFTMRVQKAKQSTEKHNGKLYAIKPGTRHMKVVYNGNVIYKKDIFLSSQQTKLINL